MNQTPPSTTALSHHLETREAMGTDDDSPDYMDTLIPREISALRYKQHHEWLEEVLSSPYDTYQILPEELGFGRKGELESLTRDFFDAHTSKNTSRELREPRTPTDKDVENGDLVVDDDPPPRVGRLAEGKADEFTKLAAQRMDEIEREMQSMRAEHSRQMKKLQDISSWKDADQKIRASTSSAINGKVTPADLTEIDNLVSTFEQKSGRRVRPLKHSECMEKGGYEDKRLETSVKSPAERKSSTPFEDSIAAPLNSGSMSSSGNPSIVNEPPRDPTPEEQSVDKTQPAPAVPTTSENHPLPIEEAAQPPSGESGVEDWIMVDQDAGAEDASNEPSAFDSFTNDSTMQIDEKPETIAADITSTAALDLGDTEFDAGLDLADFNTTGPDLPNYENVADGSELENGGSGSLANQGAPSSRDID